MKRGRPTQHDQKEIKRIIFQYYEKDISAKVAARNSKTNYKTVLKYYKKWDEKMYDTEEKDFLVRIKNTKERVIQSLDEDIITLTNDEEKIKFLIEKTLQRWNISEFEKLSKLKLKIMDQRVKTISAKINLIGTPTADTIINQNEIVI